jgi:hypothetical protein
LIFLIAHDFASLACFGFVSDCTLDWL